MSSSPTPLPPLVIYGSGGHARELALVAHAATESGRGGPLAGFLDDDPDRHGRHVDGVPVLGGADWLAAHDDHAVVLGIGAPASKRDVAQRLDRVGVRWATLVHPRAEVSPFVTLGAGVVITAGCILTSAVQLAAHVHVNRLSTIGHDCTVGAYCHVAPGTVLSGNVTIEEGCELGTGVRIIPGVRVGAWSTIGAGACVVKDVPSHVTAVGVPARVVREV